MQKCNDQLHCKVMVMLLLCSTTVVIVQ